MMKLYPRQTISIKFIPVDASAEVLSPASPERARILKKKRRTIVGSQTNMNATPFSTMYLTLHTLRRIREEVVLFDAENKKECILKQT